MAGAHEGSNEPSNKPTERTMTRARRRVSPPAMRLLRPALCPVVHNRKGVEGCVNIVEGGP